MTSPAVSILIPAYNIASFIGPCVRSVLAQTFSDWECIIVDDGSTDGTQTAAHHNPDSRIRSIRQENAGVSAARNHALALAKGRYVMFLDGDDLLHPMALARLSAALDADTGFIAAFGTFRKMLENGEPYPGQKPLRFNTYPSGDVLEPLLKENFLANGGHMLIRTEAARALGGFNESLRLSEDWEFWCRLAAKGPFQFIGKEPEIFYLRMRAGSSSGELAGNWDNHLKSIETVLGNPTIEHIFSPAKWQKLKPQIIASHLWEYGRLSFIQRRFAEARSAMLRSLQMDRRVKRLALFILAQLSQLLNLSLVSRLRFADDDKALNARLR